VKVYWTLRAKQHLRSIYDFIAADSKQAAQDTIDNITNRSKQIASFPRSGRIVSHLDNDNIREIVEGNYRIVYHLISDRIDVIAVVHTARNSILG
jgi:plasmid stabilization system protein ParE